MRRRINEAEWTSTRIRGDVHEVCVCTRTGEVIIIGAPEHGDEEHNCDANGCGWSHVLWRSTHPHTSVVSDVGGVG